MSAPDEIVSNENRQTTIEVLDWAISHIGQAHVRADILRDVRAAGCSTHAAVATTAADSVARQLTDLRNTYIHLTEERAVLRARRIASAQCLRVHRLGENCGRPGCAWQGRIAGVTGNGVNT